MHSSNRGQTKLYACLAGCEWLAVIAVLAFGSFLARAAVAAEDCAQIVSTQGVVEILRAGRSEWSRVERIDARLCEGDRLRTGPLSRAALLVGPSALIRVEQNSVLGVRLTPQATVVEFQSGAVYSISRFPWLYRILTPFLNAVVEGTEFLVTLERDQGQVAVYEGRVAVEDLIGEPGARRSLASGEVARIAQGTTPAVALLVNPADAVQWALYYPPLDPQSTGESIFELPDCEGVAAPERARCFTRRASKLLRLGRVDRAERDLQDALALVPEDAEALALTAVIRVVKNDKVGALDLAQRAVARDGRSVPALIALSYALQSHFRLEEALDAASRAAELEPGNSVAQARRAELLLSVGRIRDAEAAADVAVKANPADSRARTVLGFAQLARMDTARAREQLRQAANLDPSDALAHLGLGLAAIKDGKLAEGRGEIEIAVALDPQNALLRSYLGKAYSDEIKDGLAETQLQRAKDLDPRDPSAWFYNAIRLQALNRPEEALQDLHESIERNGNRAVYRSRLLLDQDQAARSASLARIYSDLGFDELAVTEAKYALIGDPGAYAAHRFLADAYQQRPNSEVARVSEVLQSQLLQPANAAALPPQLQQIRSPILMGSGPVTPSFQEFNPLFARDRHAFSASGVVGSVDTLSDEIVYGYYGGPRSFQLGQFYYNTDGFRTNADLRQEAYRAFYQEDLNPQTSFQAEIGYADVTSGDPRFQFDPGSFSPVQRNHVETTTFRVGARHSPSGGSTLIGSVIAQRRENEFSDTTTGTGFRLDNVNQSKLNSGMGELQYQGRASYGDVIAGVGFYEHDEHGSQSGTLTLIGPPVPPRRTIIPVDVKVKSETAYAYGYLGRPWGARVVLGLSLDSLENSTANGPANKNSEVNPKLGAIVPLGSVNTLRLAAFRGMKRLPTVNPTIEPTHVAGFNQVFDDVNETRFWRYGAALDQRWSKRLYSGIELTRRELDVPLSATVMEGRDEWLHRAFVSFAATSRIALSSEFLVERLSRESVPPNSVVLVTTKIDTRSLPLTLSYNHPSGFFARGRLSLVRQEIVSRNATGSQQQQSEDFAVVDASLGVRLPRRWGIASIDFNNLLDEKFRFRDTAFEGFPRVPLYAPERAVYARLQLNL